MRTFANLRRLNEFQVVTDGFSAEKATANSAEMRALQAGDVSYKEQSAATAARARVELDGVSAEKSVAAARVSFQPHKNLHSHFW